MAQPQNRGQAKNHANVPPLTVEDCFVQSFLAQKLLKVENPWSAYEEISCSLIEYNRAENDAKTLR